MLTLIKSHLTAAGIAAFLIIMAASLYAVGAPIYGQPTEVIGVAGGTAVPVSMAAVPLPAGAATEATLSAMSAKLPASVGAKTGAASLSVVPNTDTAFPVTGTFWQATQPVSGTFWQATQPVSAASLPLPTGASTSALQGAGLPAALGAGGGVKVDGSGTALPVSAASLPLPTGAATSALQGAGLPAALGAGGGVKIDGSGTALPVSGTFWQATQPVSGSVTATVASTTLTATVYPAAATTFAAQPYLVTFGAAVAVPLAAQADRKVISIQNPGDNGGSVYCDDVNTVTGALGNFAWQIEPGQSLTLPAAAATVIYCRTLVADRNVGVTEYL